MTIAMRCRYVCEDEQKHEVQQQPEVVSLLLERRGRHAGVSTRLHDRH